MRVVLGGRTGRHLGFPVRLHSTPNLQLRLFERLDTAHFESDFADRLQLVIQQWRDEPLVMADILKSRGQDDCSSNDFRAESRV